MTSSNVSTADLRSKAIIAGAIGALLVFGAIGAQSRAGVEVQASSSPAGEPIYVVAQADSIGWLTGSVNWLQMAAAADPSALAVAAYGN